MKNKHNVKVDGIRGFSNGFAIQWYGDIGFGEYTIYVDSDGKLKGDSECMDRGKDKTFLEQLFHNIIEQIEIT